ncbi:MAG: RNA polymerase sigma factor [Gammaproteobacteria bacterium]|jgi:RNA polymerase sigma-70 factor (ECF subfamily)|nr:RNA polymerase sigma factor [Gammaproteobacteria bacterium]MBT6043003.1 RNA polymerase sigma factor [Gammaproteobacteria bacterium]
MTGLVGESDSLIALGYDNRQAHSDTGRKALDKNHALERFLSSVEKRALRIAQIATSNSDDAFDIVQDAMFKLVEKYAGKKENEWPPLFHRILQSRIRDWYRRNTVRNRFRFWLSSDPEVEEDPFQSVADEAGRSPEIELQNSRSIDALEQALQSLPLRQQQAFMLRAWEGFDVKETAKAMACAEGSVKTHYSRAIHSLRATLGEHWHE